MGNSSMMRFIQSYVVPTSWENDTLGNPVSIVNTLIPDRDDNDWSVVYWLLFDGNNAANALYKADGILWIGFDSQAHGYTIRNNKTAYRNNSEGTSSWASAGTVIKIYAIDLGL